MYKVIHDSSLTAAGIMSLSEPAILSKVLTVKPNTDLDLAKSFLCYISSQ